MKKIISAVAFATVATSAWAQVPELGDVLGELSTTELDAFNTELDTAVEPMLDIDLDVSFDIAIVNEAVSQGLITEQDAEDLSGALAVIEDNAGYFNFDFEEFIADAIGQGWATPSEISAVMLVFDRLPPAAKTIIGDETFNPFEGLACTGGDAENDCGSVKNESLVDAIGDSGLVTEFYNQALVDKSDAFKWYDNDTLRSGSTAETWDDYQAALATQTGVTNCNPQCDLD